MQIMNGFHYYYSKSSLSYDANKGVSWIDYDRVGNPIRVQFTDHSITEHVYAADGRRLKTIHRTSIPQSTPLGIGVTAALPSSQTQSIDSVDYVGSFIYEKGQLKRYLFDDGYLKLYTNTFSPRFFIKDHLGNNRIVTDGSGNIQQNTNYYPYGGMTSISTGQGEQQFKYNGKEYDPMHGLNEYDYGARQYDPAIGKFTTMDPLCEKYYHISPYAYCGGNPVNRVDVDGRYIAWFDENNTEWRYSIDKEKFVNPKNGDIYTGNNKFLKKVSSALRKIGSVPLGRYLILELETSKNTFTIVLNKINSNFNPYNNPNAYSYQIYTDFTQSYLIDQVSEIGSGGTVYWNPEGAVLMTTEGECVYPEFDLAHEMFHALDSNYGRMDTREVQELSKNEWIAVFQENKLRQQLKYPLRKYYQKYKDSSTGEAVWGMPKMLDNMDNPINPFKRDNRYE